MAGLARQIIRPKPPLVVGFRFRRSMHRQLRALVERSKQGDARIAHSLFAKALDSCIKGELLRVECAGPEEASAFAASFAIYGVTPPTIEPWRSL